MTDDVQTYTPNGYLNLSSYLVAGDALATLEFLAAVFGSDPLRVYRSLYGAIIRAEFTRRRGLVAGS